MLNPLKKLFRYSDTVNFNVSGDLAQAVDRLSRAASKPVLQATWGESSSPSLVGSVSKDHVRLHKVTPMFGNMFKPIFVGKFQSQNGKNSLVGIFEMGPIARTIICIFIFFTLAIQILLLPGFSTDGIAIFQPTLFLLGGIILDLIMKAASRKQVSWITHQIESALH